jgi:lipid A 3-O-deacylase
MNPIAPGQQCRGIPALVAGLLFVAFWFCPRQAAAQTETNDMVFTLTEENDSLANPMGSHQDRHYTQGIRFILLWGDTNFPKLSAGLNRTVPAFGLTPTAVNFGLVVLGQHMYTPENILINPPDPADRPYAGWLYSGFVVQRRGKTSQGIPAMENLEVDLGIVGPSSTAGYFQKLVHGEFFPDDVPQGWDSQLKTEFAALIRYDRLWRLSFNDNWARNLDLIPHVAGYLGNVKIAAETGAAIRFGHNLPADFGSQLNDAAPASVRDLSNNPPDFSAYVFFRADGRAIAHNLFLDGNTFRDSASVTRNPYVFDLSYGAALQWRYFEIAYTHVNRSDEFQGQKGHDNFGSFSLRFRFDI